MTGQITARFEPNPLGMLDGVLLLAVIHTERDGDIRLISARRANRIERQRYEKALRQRINN